MKPETHGIWRLPHPSQEFEKGPEAHLVDGTLTIRYDFENDAGTYEWSSFRFNEVTAFLFADPDLCDEDQIAAYDTVVEVAGSRWLEMTRAAPGSGPHGSHHYRVYFDEHGCYEVLSARFEPPTDI